MNLLERLPVKVSWPAEPDRRRRAAVARWAACVLLAAAMIAPVVQFQLKTLKTLRLAAAGPSGSGDGHWGAIGRWRGAVQAFWEGRNIYLALDQFEADGTPPVHSLHPNMPFVVLLLTPLTYLPVGAMAITFNLLKVLALVSAALMAARVAGHRGGKIPDWILGAALAWAIPLLIDDILHGNTNGFVLWAVVLHLWLYRRGQNFWSGTALALAVCLKMTPALFGVYWLYQRNWRLLGGLAVALAVFGLIVPGVALGPERATVVTRTWLDNLIVPGLIKGSWYPVHINQSVLGVFGRYFLGGRPGGDIFWNPDDNPYVTQTAHGWIAFVSLPEGTVQALVKLAHLAIMALLAWAIGWRKLPRDDGRRALHYGLVAVGMMLLNQRTWEHHAGVLLAADAAIWYAIVFGRISRPVRSAAMALMLLAGATMVLSLQGTYRVLAWVLGRGSELGGVWSDLSEAYGGCFYHFLMLLAAGVLLAVALKRPEDPYAPERQKF